MELNNVEIDNYTLEELDTEAAKVQIELKHTRDQLDESNKQLAHMKKKQRVLQIRKSTAELNELKELLAKNQQQIKQIDTDIKIIQQGKSESTFIHTYILKSLS